ncbi:MAG: 50S ribosomal protein L24 [Patescibacteria group bacterium]
MNLKKGDQVKIISGKDRGKTGTVFKVFTKDDRLTVEGLNLFKKRARPKKQGQKGETVLVPRPMPISKVMLVCQNCKKSTRVGFRVEGDKKVRICKKCDATT